MFRNNNADSLYLIFYTHLSITDKIKIYYLLYNRGTNNTKCKNSKHLKKNLNYNHLNRRIYTYYTYYFRSKIT